MGTPSTFVSPNQKGLPKPLKILKTQRLLLHVASSLPSISCTVMESRADCPRTSSLCAPLLAPRRAGSLDPRRRQSACNFQLSRGIGLCLVSQAVASAPFLPVLPPPPSVHAGGISSRSAKRSEPKLRRKSGLLRLVLHHFR